MSTDALLQRLIDTVDNFSTVNVHQSICSLYDTYRDFTPDILKKFAEHYGVSLPALAKTDSFMEPQYLIFCLPFVMFYSKERKHDVLVPLLNDLVKFINETDLNRAYDRLVAKFLFFYALNVPDPVKTLLTTYRRACDIHFQHTQATIVNCVLKCYIDIGAYKLALSFLKNCNFPGDVSPAQLGRYHFFVGQLEAITLNYGEAQHHLQSALRRAPQNKYSQNFRELVTRHLMVVMMLRGQVPARSMLVGTPDYLELARSILKGDLIKFQEVMSKEVFKKDGLDPLVQRLRSSVILAGLTMISQCYSKIEFSDIADRLKLDSAEDAEGFCAKAAADGLIDAIIEHNNGCLVSRSIQDESGLGFSERINRNIQDCFGIREDTQRAMHEVTGTD